MPPRPRPLSSDNPKAAASRSWRASLIRSTTQVFGEMEALSRAAAEAAAVRTFKLNPEQSSADIRSDAVVCSRHHEGADPSNPTPAVSVSCQRAVKWLATKLRRREFVH
jgi:hypothetical protein